MHLLHLLSWSLSKSVTCLANLLAAISQPFDLFCETLHWKLLTWKSAALNRSFDSGGFWRSFPFNALTWRLTSSVRCLDAWEVLDYFSMIEVWKFRNSDFSDQQTCLRPLFPVGRPAFWNWLMCFINFKLIKTGRSVTHRAPSSSRGDSEIVSVRFQCSMAIVAT